MNKHVTYFNTVDHSYTIDGRPVPSVTQVINSCMPYAHKVEQWYLDRGRSVHSAASLIATHRKFTSDPQIDGQVCAIRRFFSEVNPEVRETEGMVFSKTYMYAGCFDLLAVFNGKLTLFDWKADLDERVAWQLAGYSLAYGKPEIRYGIGVEIRENGTYKMSAVYDLRRYGREFLAMLTVYNIRQRCGITTKSEES